ncbi:hypothetical protein Pelo_7565 [Pelomyxa schiedti]|nr:hypothetical protein Pelo_7565 [Pelomyxa schiedti]
MSRSVKKEAPLPEEESPTAYQSSPQDQPKEEPADFPSSDAFRQTQEVLLQALFEVKQSLQNQQSNPSQSQTPTSALPFLPPPPLLPITAPPTIEQKIMHQQQEQDQQQQQTQGILPANSNTSPSSSSAGGSGLATSQSPPPPLNTPQVQALLQLHSLFQKQPALLGAGANGSPADQQQQQLLLLQQHVLQQHLVQQLISQNALINTAAASSAPATSSPQNAQGPTLGSVIHRQPHNLIWESDGQPLHKALFHNESPEMGQKKKHLTSPPTTSPPSILGSGDKSLELLLSTCKIFKHKRFQMIVKIDPHLRQHLALSCDDILVAGLNARCCRENSDEEVENCAQCSPNRKVVSIGVSAQSPFHPVHVLNGVPTPMEVFIFDDCKSNCSSSRDHLHTALTLVVELQPGTVLHSSSFVLQSRAVQSVASKAKRAQKQDTTQQTPRSRKRQPASNANCSPPAQQDFNTATTYSASIPRTPKHPRTSTSASPSPSSSSGAGAGAGSGAAAVTTTSPVTPTSYELPTNLNLTLGLGLNLSPGSNTSALLGQLLAPGFASLISAPSSASQIPPIAPLAPLAPMAPQHSPAPMSSSSTANPTTTPLSHSSLENLLNPQQNQNQLP